MGSALLVGVLSLCVTGVLGQHNGSQVYDADHFEELALRVDGSGLVDRNIVLCMHTDACTCDVRTFSRYSYDPYLICCMCC